MFNLEKQTTRRSHRRVGYEELKRVIAIMRQDERFSQRFPGLLGPARAATPQRPVAASPQPTPLQRVVAVSSSPKHLADIPDLAPSTAKPTELSTPSHSTSPPPSLYSVPQRPPSRAHLAKMQYEDSKSSPYMSFADDTLVEDASLQNLFGYQRNNPRNSFHLTPARLSTQISSKLLERRPRSRRFGSKRFTTGKRSLEVRENHNTLLGENSLSQLAVETPSAYFQAGSPPPAGLPMSVGHHSISPMPARRVKSIRIVMQNYPNVSSTRRRQGGFFPRLNGKCSGMQYVQRVKSLRSVGRSDVSH